MYIPFHGYFNKVALEDPHIFLDQESTVSWISKINPPTFRASWKSRISQSRDRMTLTARGGGLEKPRNSTFASEKIYRSFQNTLLKQFWKEKESTFFNYDSDFKNSHNSDPCPFSGIHQVLERLSPFVSARYNIMLDTHILNVLSLHWDVNVQRSQKRRHLRK